MKRNQSRVILLSGSRTRARRLAEDLRDYNLSSFYSEDMDREVEPGEIMTAYGYIAEGYEYPLLNFVVISETDISERIKGRKKRRTTYEGRKIQSFSELNLEIMWYMRIMDWEFIKELKKSKWIRFPKTI